MVKEKGVSPVIATILMVAITVVLATTVYLLVFTNMINSPYPTNQFIATLTVDPQHSNNLHINLTISMSNPNSISFSMVRITIYHNGKYTNLHYVQAQHIWTNYSIGEKWYYKAKIIDINKNGKLDSGDQISVYVVGIDPQPFNAGDEIILNLIGYNGNAKAYLTF